MQDVPFRVDENQKFPIQPEGGLGRHPLYPASG
jgi:hypothetical protein